MTTSNRRARTLSNLVNQDEGIGLILVIGISAMMAILLAVITATAIRSLGSSSDHVKFEQSLAASEAGIDRELSNIQSARNQVPSVAYESSSTCRPATPAASVFATRGDRTGLGQGRTERSAGQLYPKQRPRPVRGFQGARTSDRLLHGLVSVPDGCGRQGADAEGGVHLCAVPPGQGAAHRRQHRLLGKRRRSTPLPGCRPTSTPTPM